MRGNRVGEILGQDRNKTKQNKSPSQESGYHSFVRCSLYVESDAPDLLVRDDAERLHVEATGLLQAPLQHAVHLHGLLLVVAEPRALLEARRARRPKVHVYPENNYNKKKLFGEIR